MAPERVAFYITIIMQQHEIIRSSTDSKGSYIDVVLAGADYTIRVVTPSAAMPVDSPTSCLVGIIREFSNCVLRNNLTFLWEKLMIPAGEVILVQTECRGASREEVRRFVTEAEYDEFRTARLSDYNIEEDAPQVANLLSEGLLDAAWDLACADDEEYKVLWDTDFGSHYVERLPNLVPFKSLPSFMQTAFHVEVRV